jgi:hypothetical protein
MRKELVLFSLAACNLGPRVDDIQTDAPLGVDAPVETYLLPSTATVPLISSNPELVNQIRANDGLSDSALMMNNNVILRSTGKSAGQTVRYWNFGPTPVQDNFAVGGLVYILGTSDGTTFTPLPNHPPMIDTICGDVRYSALRRVFNVVVTPSYHGERITSLLALGEALQKGLVEDPVPDGTWENLPVVPPDTKLEVGLVDPLPAKQIYARGYLVDVFELGTSLGRQPYRNNLIPIGQASALQTGVATGTPPTLPVAVDAQLVFQYPVPTVAPGTTFSYSPIANDITVRLANGIAPATITGDADLFRRNTSGSITAFLVDNVSEFTVGTSYSNLQLQFVEGMP